MPLLNTADDVRFGSVTVDAVHAGPVKVWPAPAVWTPADIPGLGLWLDASQLALADGAAVTVWPDASGAGRHATAMDTPPVYQSAVMNGSPGVVFNTSPVTRLLVPGWGTALSGKTEYTLFLVLNQTAHMGNYPVIAAAPTYTTWAWLLEWDISRSFYWGSGANSLRLYGLNATVGAPYLFTLHKLTAGPKLYLNRVDHSTNYTVSSGVDMAPTVPNIGADVNLGGYYTGDYGITGPVSEVIWYDHAITDAERLQVEDYLTVKYGPFVAATQLPAIPDAPEPGPPPW